MNWPAPKSSDPLKTGSDAHGGLKSPAVPIWAGLTLQAGLYWKPRPNPGRFLASLNRSNQHLRSCSLRSKSPRTRSDHGKTIS